MTSGNALNINLASQPLRNRRFFFILVGGLVAATLIVSSFAGFYFFKYRARRQSVQSELANMERLVQAAQKEKSERTAEIKELSQKYKEKIDLINSIIMNKSFSWVEFFSYLEDALPASSFISWIAPVQAGAGKFEVKFKVVSQRVGELLHLIQNLNALKFKQISVQSESKLGGRLVSELSIAYERTF
jgi:hypothetical protein